MTRFLHSAALLAILFAFASAAEANGLNKTGGSMGHGPVSRGGEHHGPGRTYSRDHHWNSRYWNSRYGCDYCYSSVDRCYFYFYAPASCYYPVASIGEYPPTPLPAPVPGPVATTTPASLPVPIAPVIPPSTVVQVNQNTNVR